MTDKVVLLVLVSIEIEDERDTQAVDLYVCRSGYLCNMQFDFERSEGYVAVYIMMLPNLCRLDVQWQQMNVNQ